MALKSKLLNKALLNPTTPCALLPLVPTIQPTMATPESKTMELSPLKIPSACENDLSEDSSSSTSSPSYMSEAASSPSEDAPRTELPPLLPSEAAEESTEALLERLACRLEIDPVTGEPKEHVTRPGPSCDYYFQVDIIYRELVHRYTLEALQERGGDNMYDPCFRDPTPAATKRRIRQRLRLQLGTLLDTLLNGHGPQLINDSSVPLKVKKRLFLAKYYDPWKTAVRHALKILAPVPEEQRGANKTSHIAAMLPNALSNGLTELRGIEGGPQKIEVLRAAAFFSHVIKRGTAYWGEMFSSSMRENNVEAPQSEFSEWCRLVKQVMTWVNTLVERWSYDDLDSSESGPVLFELGRCAALCFRSGLVGKKPFEELKGSERAWKAKQTVLEMLAVRDELQQQDGNKRQRTG